MQLEERFGFQGYQQSNNQYFHSSSTETLRPQQSKFIKPLIDFCNRRPVTAVTLIASAHFGLCMLAGASLPLTCVVTVGVVGLGYSWESKAVKAHNAFIKEQLKGYEATVVDRATGQKIPATMRLKDINDTFDPGRVVHEKIVNSRRTRKITGRAYVAQENIDEEHLSYELVSQGEQLGRISLQMVNKRDATGKPSTYFAVVVLFGSDGGPIGNVGDELIRLAILISEKKGFKGALKVEPGYNSPGFYWLEGLTYSMSSVRYVPQYSKELLRSVAIKLRTKTDHELASDQECFKLKKVIAARKIAAEEQFTSNRESLIEERAKTITTQEIRTAWPEILRLRQYYEPLNRYDAILDELALARLGLPRLKIRYSQEPKVPDTSPYLSTWNLPAMTVEQWQRIKNERRLELGQRMKDIREGRLMTEEQL